MDSAAMTTIWTGGFSTHRKLCFYNSHLIEAIAIIFMLISATTFFLLFDFLRDQGAYLKRIEVSPFMVYPFQYGFNFFA